MNHVKICYIIFYKIDNKTNCKIWNISNLQMIKIRLWLKIVQYCKVWKHKWLICKEKKLKNILPKKYWQVMKNINF